MSEADEKGARRRAVGSAFDNLLGRVVAALTGPHPIRNWLLISFSLLSFGGTTIGMMDLASAQLEGWELALAGLLVIPAVFFFTLGMVYSLDRLIGHGVGLFQRLGYGLFYLVVLFFSVGFGTGFYYKFIGAERETNASVEARLEDFERELVAARGSFFQSTQAFGAAARTATDVARGEARSGGTCGDGAPPGGGPRCEFLRSQSESAVRAAGDMQSILSGARFVPNVSDAPRIDCQNPNVSISGETAPSEIAAPTPTSIDGMVAEVQRRSTEFEANYGNGRGGTQERRAYVSSLEGELRRIAAAYNEIATSRQLREYNELYSQTATNFGNATHTFTRGSDTFQCFNEELAANYSAAAQSIVDLPALPDPVLPFNEGSEATREALQRVAALLPVVGELARDPEDAATGREAEVREALTYLALGIAAIVDFGILIFTLDRTGGGFFSRIRANAARAEFAEALGRMAAEGLIEADDLRDYEIVDDLGQVYTAVPVRLEGPADRMLYDLVELGVSARYIVGPERIAFLRRFQHGKVQRMLESSGSPLAERGAKFRLYRVRSGGGMSTLLTQHRLTDNWRR